MTRMILHHSQADIHSSKEVTPSCNSSSKVHQMVDSPSGRAGGRSRSNLGVGPGREVDHSERWSGGSFGVVALVRSLNNLLAISVV